jgi:REP element-mobilizing transposase RayT
MSTKLAPEQFYHRNLPHIQPPGSTFFVTFRLAGSLPRILLMELQAETQRLQAEIEREPDPVKRAARAYQEHKRFFGKWDQALDEGSGPDWLRNPAVAALIADSLHFHDGARYELIVYCIMPNHVHVVIRPLLKDGEQYYSLAQIMHTMKGYTAGRANRLLGRTGAFWQHESYDHVVRDAGELDRIVAYVVNNPVKAGLVTEWQKWSWTYYRDR